ncbi:MAG: N-acetyltransferase [Chloroflexi bacterium]|nr:N-acetyltransferase [Chloroflexota bacterium]
MEHRGVARRLAQLARDAARAEGLTVVPRCPFLANFKRLHPERVHLLELAGPLVVARL